MDYLKLVLEPHDPKQTQKDKDRVAIYETPYHAYNKAVRQYETQRTQYETKQQDVLYKKR